MVPTCNPKLVVMVQATIYDYCYVPSLHGALNAKSQHTSTPTSHTWGDKAATGRTGALIQVSEMPKLL